MLSIQSYLVNHTFGELEEAHGIKASFDPKGYKFSLNYDQLNSRESDPLAQQCRGLILATHDGHSLSSEAINTPLKLDYRNVCPGFTQVLAYPMNRFFNFGQGAAANVNFNDPKLQVMEKLDGTLTIVYFDKFSGEWCVATRSVPEANIEIDSGYFTFRTLFEKGLLDSLSLKFNDFTSKLNDKYTYCFELTSPYNRVVVDYKTASITLLAVRNTKYHDEVDISNVDIGVPHVRTYTLTCMNDIVNWVSEQNPMEHEGVVVMDSDFRRIKVKNASYIAYSKARDVFGASDRNCLELVLSEKEDDVIPALPPEIVDRIMDIKQATQKVIKLYDDFYFDAKKQADEEDLGNRKVFARIVTSRYLKDKSFWISPLFFAYSGKSSGMRDFIKQNCKDGTWSNSFLDKILDIAKKFRV